MFVQLELFNFRYNL